MLLHVQGTLLLLVLRMMLQRLIVFFFVVFLLGPVVVVLSEPLSPISLPLSQPRASSRAREVLVSQEGLFFSSDRCLLRRLKVLVQSEALLVSSERPVWASWALGCLGLVLRVVLGESALLGHGPVTVPGELRVLA